MNKATSSQIDIIMPIYNGEAFVAQSIDSILHQSFKDVRIIVVNDGSSDRSLQIVSALAKKQDNIEVIDLPRRGLSAALNEALKHVTAAWLAFLDCDDLWHTEKLAKQLDYLIENPAVDLCFTQLTEFDDRNKLTGTHAARTQVLNGTGKSALLCRPTVFEKVGGFNEDTQLGDFLEWFGLCQLKGIIHTTLPEVLTYRRVHDGNMSQGASASDYLKLLRRHLQHKAAAKTSE
jgi:glycosyltransferase involved in cell wall biosynthesis